MDSIARLAIYPLASQAEVRQLIEEVSERLRRPSPEVIQDAVAFPGVTPDELRAALDEASPGWQERGLVYWPGR